MERASPTVPIVGFAPVGKRSAIGVVPNAAHQPDQGFVDQGGHDLAVVEFDDQGRCYRRGQLDPVADRLDAMRAHGDDVILLAFVHGWKHDARSDDADLASFRWMLERTAEHEGARAPRAPRRVMGVFVGWRGLSAHGLAGVVDDLTFWGRQAAAHRVATGSVRELFGRMRHYRNARLKRGGAPLLVIAGHSFGGLIVYSALAQSLIESASAPAGQVIPGFADLVLLANPAFEGARFLPIHDLVTSDRFQRRVDGQLPVFVCVQAENDQPVGRWFPIGNLVNRLGEAAIGALERRCLSHAIGFIDQFRTHRLTGAPVAPFALDPPQSKRRDPFWVVAATKEVIDGHGGIWSAPFVAFVSALIFQHVNLSRSTGAGGAIGAGAVPAGAGAGSLADFARGLAPPVGPATA